MTRLLLCFLLFVCNSSYSREEPEYSKTYTPDEYYYLSSKIPKEVRQLIMNVNMAPPLAAIFKKELVQKYGLFTYISPKPRGDENHRPGFDTKTPGAFLNRACSGPEGARSRDGLSSGAASWTDDEPARRLPEGRAKRVNSPLPASSKKSLYESIRRLTNLDAEMRFAFPTAKTIVPGGWVERRVTQHSYPIPQCWVSVSPHPTLPRRIMCNRTTGLSSSSAFFAYCNSANLT